MAASCDPQVDGLIIARRFEQSELNTFTMRPLVRSMATTLPWYAGSSPMKPRVTTGTQRPARLSAEAIFSWLELRVIDTGQWPERTCVPFDTRSLWTSPSGEAANT